MITLQPICAQLRARKLLAGSNVYKVCNTGSRYQKQTRAHKKHAYTGVERPIVQKRDTRQHAKETYYRETNADGRKKNDQRMYGPSWQQRK